MRQFTPDPKPEPGKRGGKTPRQAGKRVEKKIADQLGEKPTAGSGAFKNTNKNLTGDIDVRDNDGRDYIKLEVKMTGQVNTAGEKVYSFKEKELKQAVEEAHAAGELAAFAFHYKNGTTWVAMPFLDWKAMLEDAKLGRTAQK